MIGGGSWGQGTDTVGLRFTVFATNTRNTPIAAIELRRRRRARAEDRIRVGRATGLRNICLSMMPHGTNRTITPSADPEEA
ncbi:hypothetical protein GCM10022233_69390 [Streptomyces shaanxiensis]|uniref:Uncharacterized protein n=1 Tax=Streptomyces shaanxiensis TaxID=653357 RepID=A0ABP7W4Q5_9ACTN